MPKIITQIAVQKKRKNRCSIFLDDEYAFGVDQEIVFQFGLKKGDMLTDQQIEEISINEEKKRAKDRALNFLSYRDRSEKEIRTKLKDVGYEENIIDWVIGELQRLKFLDDQRFAQSYAQTQMITRPMGEYFLKRELKQKGIDTELIEQTVEKIYEEKDQVSVALELAQQRKKRNSNIDEMKAKKRVSDFLLRRGFSWDVVSEVLEQWDELK
ncbi:MAG TPA: RecX family transcriptional regulator [bacterium]